MSEYHGRRLKESRMCLAQAVTRSTADNSRATRRHLAAAARAAHEGAANDVGDRIDRVLGRDVTAVSARTVMRNCMQLLDCELEPAAVFETASGGAEL